MPGVGAAVGSALSAVTAPSEANIQAKMRSFEQARQAGAIIPSGEMDAAGQEAMRRLVKGQTPAPPPAAAAAAPNAAQVPPPQAAPPANQSGAQNVTPQQGGIWADAEAMQKNRAMAGVPMVK